LSNGDRLAVRSLRSIQAEVIMNVTTLRHDPWTCEWGRFGLTVEQVSARESRVDDVFWACHHPVLAPHVKALRRAECETCPLWDPASRLSPEAPL
jgi:hypothetical protein